MPKTPFAQKFISCFIAGLTLSALWLSIGNGGNISWLPPILIFSLVNVFYQMNLGALLQSLILTIGILFLLLLDYRRLVYFFLRAKSELPGLIWNSPLSKNILRLSAIILPLLFTLYLKSLMK